MTAMIRSAYSRLQQLEKQEEVRRRLQDPEERLRRAVAADEAGTASMEQYSLVHSDNIPSWQEWLCAYTPVMVACEQVGRYFPSPLTALAYPPTVDLPAHVFDHFYSFRARATSSLRTQEEQQRHSWLADGYTADGRRDAAFVLLILGDDDGMQMRRRVWEEQPGGWVLEPATREAARRDGFTLEVAKVVFGEPIWEASVNESPSVEEPWLEAFYDPDDDAMWIPYREAARIIGLDRQGKGDPRLARIWSDLVKTGQEQDS